MVLSVRGVQAAGLTGPVSFELRAGEILGLAGQLGSGANAMIRTIPGTFPCERGCVLLRSETLHVRSMRQALGRGIAYCSDDRKRDGIFAVRKVVENLTAPSLPRITVAGLLSRRREEALSRRLAEFFEIAVGRLCSQAGKLSGGNQQKLALGKWLGIDPAILLVEEPTRGVDVGARAEIYRHLRALASRGMAIVFASSDNQEVLGLADTVASFFRGRLVRIAPAESLDEPALLRDVTHPAPSEPPLHETGPADRGGAAPPA